MTKKYTAPFKHDDKKPILNAQKIVIEREQIVIPPSFKARLEIGYPPIRESYISNVSIIRPNLVKSVSRDTRLFEFLINEWKFHPVRVEQLPTKVPSSSGHEEPNPEDQVINQQTCLVEFFVSFKFRSPVYNRFSALVMDQIFSKMVQAFTNRALVLYGKPSTTPRELMHSH